MTVQQMIECLSKLPQDAMVVVAYDGEYCAEASEPECLQLYKAGLVLTGGPDPRVPVVVIGK